MTVIGRVHQLVRYPVKSMAGVPADSMALGFHGFAGDRRFAFRRLADEAGFPWLSASRLPELLLYMPERLEESGGEPLPTHVRTPTGTSLALRGAELTAELAQRFGSPLELMKLRNGIFDDAAVSVISLATIAGLGREAGMAMDPRRYRANVLLAAEDAAPFHEDDWVGGTLVFGDDDAGPAVSVTLRDLRCVMINLDPDTAVQDARVMKTAVRLNQNFAGVYGAVLRTGVIHVGDRVRLRRPA